MKPRRSPFSREVWLLIFGRLLLQLGTGFVLVYAPIYFVNQLEFSATAVGLSVGAGQVAGVLGRILSGSLADSPQFGRQRVLVMSAIASALADLALIATSNLSLLLLGNLLMGFGVGLYWPAMEALVADLTTPETSREAYAFSRLADVIGLGCGVALGGMLISLTGMYQLLFGLDGLSFLVFGGLLGLFIQDRPQKTHGETHNQSLAWKQALSDRTLQVFVVVNTLFTVYLSQIDATLPLYLTNIVKLDDGTGFSETMISWLFSWHIAVAALMQLPVARLTRSHSHAKTLAGAAALFALGFFCLWMAGAGGDQAVLLAIIALGILSLGMVTYAPSGSAFVIDIAPESLRGTYLAIGSLCWAAGYSIGPSLGGLALDASTAIARQYWLYLMLSSGLCLLILTELRRRVRCRVSQS